MHAGRKRKLQLICAGAVLFGIVAALVLYALRQNISLFYTPTQVVSGDAPRNHLIRVGGMVVPGSIVRKTKDLSVQFQITDYRQTVTVHYEGILPDLFREGQGIVTEGRVLANGHVDATDVLAKHDENYMPPEVKAALQPQRAG